MPACALATVPAKPRAHDDQPCWRVALVTDNAMRGAGATGMPREGIVRDDGGALCALVRAHPWRWPMTKDCVCEVTLEGAARREAERILCHKLRSRFAVARQDRTDSTTAKEGRAALNKRMNDYIPAGCSMHSSRHAMRDRLRAARCRGEISGQTAPADGQALIWHRPPTCRRCQRR